MAETDIKEKKLLNVIIFIFYDYFNNVLTTFLGLEHFICVVSMQAQKALGFHQNILICVLTMNEGIMGLE